MKEEQIILKGLQQGSEQAYKDLFTAYFSDLDVQKLFLFSLFIAQMVQACIV